MSSGSTLPLKFNSRCTSSSNFTVFLLLECYFENLLNGNYLPFFFSAFRSWAPQFCTVFFLFCSVLFNVSVPHLVTIRRPLPYTLCRTVQNSSSPSIELHPFSIYCCCCCCCCCYTVAHLYSISFSFATEYKGRRRKRSRLTTLPHISYWSPNSVFNVCCCCFFSCHRRPGETCIFFLLVICNAVFLLSSLFLLLFGNGYHCWPAAFHHHHHHQHFCCFQILSF